MLSAAESGAVILTANSRAARQCRRLYDARQQERGRVAWPSASVLAWSAWLDSLWQGYVLLPGRRTQRRLNAVQEPALWERVIAESEAGSQFLSPRGAANTAQDAWTLLHDYCVADLSLLETTEHGRMFRSWAGDFARICDQRGWIDSARLADLLLCAISSGIIAVPQRIIFAAFDKFTPRQHRFVAALQGAGTACEIAAENTAPAETISCIGVNDSSAEIQNAAEWARARLEQQPTARIGIVVPELERLRNRIERVFAEVLSPATLAASSRSRPFELSLGRALAAVPAVHTALDLLRWLAGPLPIAAAGTLIRSPFLTSASGEAGLRAQVDAAMRRACGPEVSIGDVLRVARDSRHSCPELASLLMAAARDFNVEPKAASAWCPVFAAALKAIGWPGERALDSLEHQAVQAWLDLLRQFGTLEITEPALSLSDAVVRLAQLAGDRTFQPENIGAPVQVLGLLEAAGSQFDHLWVMGLTDESWPPRAKPNPLLPLALQRRCGMPHSSADDDLGFARLVTDRLRCSAREVVFSWPEVEGERPLRPSPLLRPLPQRTIRDVMPQPRGAWIAEIQACSEALQAVDERANVEVQSTDVRGGSRILQLQAACPFRAFAELRLGAAPLELPNTGLDGRDRGKLVHRVLERVWQELESSANLNALATNDLRALITRCVDSELSQFHPLQRDEWTRQFARLERERLIGLVSDWLEVEKRRLPFAVVSHEQRYEISVGGVPLKLRVDRVDRLGDGRRVLIDYKTGAPKSLADAWDGERPDEPQLPLYAVTVPGDIAALAFAHLKTGNLKFVGQSAERDILPQVSPPAKGTLVDRIAQWKEVLKALGESYLAGDARVDPKDPVQSCRYCELAALCRVGERAMNVAEDTEDADG